MRNSVITFVNISLAAMLAATMCGRAFAGSTQYIYAAGGGSNCEENPQDPGCACEEDTDPTCTGEDPEEFSSFRIDLPPTGIARERIERFARFRSGAPLVRARSVEGRILAWGAYSAHVVNPVTGEKELELLTEADGIDPQDIIFNEQKRTYEVMTRNGAIIQIDEAGTKTEIVAPWLNSPTGKSTVFTRLENYNNDAWTVALQDLEPDLHRLYKVEMVFGSPRMTPLGPFRATPYLYVHCAADPYLVYAADASGKLYGVSSNQSVDLGTFPFTPVGITIVPDSRGEKVAYATDTLGSLYKAELPSGLISYVGQSDFLRDDPIIFSHQDERVETRIVASYSQVDGKLRFTNSEGAPLPNLAAMEMERVIGTKPASEIRFAVGNFLDPDEPTLVIAQYDRGVTSTAAAIAHVVSLRDVRPEGHLAVERTLVPYGLANKGGMNVARFVRGPGLVDGILFGAPGVLSYAPHVRGFYYDYAIGDFRLGTNMFAYGTLNFGVNVAAGDIDGDGEQELVTGPGPGAVFGAQVRGFDVDPVTMRVRSAMSKVNFIAHGSRFGVEVACADVDTDGQEEIIAGAGAGPTNGAAVRGFKLTSSGIQAIGLNVLLGTACSGARVSAGQLDQDEAFEVIVTRGTDGAGTIYEIDRLAAGGYSVTSFAPSTGPTNGVGGSIGTAGDYKGTTSSYWTIPWPTRIRVWNRRVTHVWMDTVIDDTSCYARNNAAFHLGFLPGGGAAMDAQGRFSFTADESNGLPITVTMQGQLIGNSITGAVAFTYRPCGWTKTLRVATTR